MPISSPVYSGGSLELGDDVAASIRKLFASNLERLLLENELTQREFAKRLGVDESIVSKWLSQATYPQEASMNMIRDKLGWSFEEFFREGFEKEPVAARDLDAVVRKLADVLGYEVVKKP